MANPHLALPSDPACLRCAGRGVVPGPLRSVCGCSYRAVHERVLTQCREIDGYPHGLCMDFRCDTVLSAVRVLNEQEYRVWRWRYLRNDSVRAIAWRLRRTEERTQELLNQIEERVGRAYVDAELYPISLAFLDAA